MRTQEKYTAAAEELAQINKQLLLMENRTRTQERKARTRRLIRLGAEVCARLHIRDPTDSQIEAIADFISEQEARGNFVSRYIKRREEQCYGKTDDTGTASGEGTKAEGADGKAADGG